ncbi:replication endonuclease, partial [Chitinimonas sp. BJB300]|uniref:replication endonuclease n=1 Tax=Chitinimonas sp. BJB300 TaxID=1559339 RepID=UPI0011824608
QGRISAGQVRRGADTYVSQQTLSLLQTKWKDQSEALRHALATSNEGDEVSLFDLQQSSVANPRVRFAELITRVKGFELVAEELGHTAVFVTVTAPSAYHPSKTISNKRKRGKRAFTQIINPAWVAAGKPTPKQANDYLCQTWGKVRAAADRRGLRVYGLRTTEPHADACPHWHMMLFGEPEALTRFVALFQDYACQAYPEELTGKVWNKEAGKWHKVPATSVRFNCQVMNPAQVLADGSRVGGAVAYLTKYLTKNLDGKSEQRREDGEHLAMGDDYEADTDSITGAQKVRAWASLWHVRQFQFYGGPPVALWRELRKLRGTKQDDTVIDQAATAADTGDWSLFCQLLGGPLARRKDLPLSLAKEDRPEQVNRYGEAACAVVKGVEAGSAKVVTRTKTWAIDWRKKQSMFEGAAEGLAARTGEARPSRTCANNCTQLLADALTEPLPLPEDQDFRDDHAESDPPPGWDAPVDLGFNEPPPFDAGYFDHCADAGPPEWWTDRDECAHLDGNAELVRCEDGL